MKTNRRSPKPREKNQRRQHAPSTRSDPKGSHLTLFPIVGVGASAGGLEAFTELLEHLPPDSGMAFVLVQHLAPKHESALGGLLSRHTPMPVAEVRDRMVIEPNHVYVIPPNANMTVREGRLHLVPRTETAVHMPINYFLQGLADDRQDRAIGVILSGSATDGTLGLKAIKAAGGITFAQSEKSARYDSMPRSAITSGAVDFILPPEGIARELARIGRHPDLEARREATHVTEPLLAEGTDSERLFSLLKGRTGVDFTHYRTPTLNRRLQRRMMMKGIATLRDYLQYLRENPAECEALYDDILIHVTSFFRDPKIFEALKKAVYPALLQKRERDSPVRVWVPGCSTGEEVYSTVISLMEYLGEGSRGVPIQAFATDISEKAILAGRQGVYGTNIAEHVSPERLRRFFTKKDNCYQINKNIRDSVVFARHDVTRDPPYSRLDLVICRNLLIFLGPVLQKNVFRAIHYALNSTGYLVLGSSETVGDYSDYFAIADRKNKIYRKKMTGAPLAMEFVSAGVLAQPGLPPASLSYTGGGLDLGRETDRVMMERYGPPGVLVNEDFEVLQFRGHTGPYLDPVPGVATLALLKIAHGDLVYGLRTALHKAKKTKAEVRIEGVKVTVNGQTRTINLQVIPISGATADKRHFLVFLEQPQAPDGKAEPKKRGSKPSPEAKEIVRLEKELKAAKEFMRSAVEDQDAANEELRTTNEEFLSSNEELQTTNEELETTKEELQSTNEELTTLNEELQNRNTELSKLGNDLRNILNSAYSGIALVGRDLSLRFFDPRAAKILNLIPTDVGRRLGDIKPNLEIPDLAKLTSRVIVDSVPQEVDCPAPNGSWYEVRIQPYVLEEGGNDGAVIAVADITEHHREKVALQQSQAMFEQLFEASPDALVTVDENGKIVRVNAGAEEMFCYEREELKGHPVEVLLPERFRKIHVSHRQELLSNLRKQTMGAGLRLYARRKDGTELPVDIMLAPLETAMGRQVLTVLHDISKRTEAEERLREFSMRRIQVQDEERQRVSRELHDTTGPSLAALVMNLALAEKSARKLSPAVRKPLRESMALAKRCAEEVRTVSYQLHPPLLDEVGLKAALSWYVSSYSQLTGIKVQTSLPAELGRLPRDMEVSLFRIVQEALSNVQRHSKSREAVLKIGLNADAIMAQIKDGGMGFPANSTDGLGLRGIRERVQSLKGELEIASNKHGTTLDITIPLPAGYPARPTADGKKASEAQVSTG